MNKEQSITTEPVQAQPDGLLSIRDLGEYLSVSRTFATKLATDGSIPSFKLGQLRRVRKSDVDAYIERQRARQSERD